MLVSMRARSRYGAIPYHQSHQRTRIQQQGSLTTDPGEQRWIGTAASFEGWSRNVEGSRQVQQTAVLRWPRTGYQRGASDAWFPVDRATKSRLNWELLFPGAVDYHLRLPKVWMGIVGWCDQSWAGGSLFVSKGNMTTNLDNWLMQHPLHSATHTVESHFDRCLFLWMRRKMWDMVLFCHVGSRKCCHHLHR